MNSRWLLREVHYPQWKRVNVGTTNASTEIEVDGLSESLWSDTVSTTRIELLWQPWLVSTNAAMDVQPFPTFKDMLDGIYESELRFGRQPDIMVVTPPVGTKYFGIEIR